MIKVKYLIIMLLVFATASLTAQTRVGSCKGATSSDRIYITPYVGAGFAKVSFLGTNSGVFSYLGGVTALYGFDNFRLGLGGKYQVYNKDGGYQRKVIKPFLVIEYPLYFGEFEDFGFYTHLGPSFHYELSQTLMKENAFFIDLGIYYNLVITPSSGLYLGLDYGYNYVYHPDFKGNGYNINEFKLNLGYRFWF